MKETLLEKAKKIKKRKNTKYKYNKEILDLVLDYLNGNITMRQISAVLSPDYLKSVSGGNVLYFTTYIIKEAVLKNDIKIIKQCPTTNTETK